MTTPMTTGARIRRALRRGVLGLILVGALVVGGTAFRVWQVGRIDDRTHADAVVVLGAAQYNGKPTPVLQARLEHAERLYHDGVAHYIITSGGKRTGDRYTEADAGVRWLTEHGVPANRVIPVGEGSDTLGTMQAVASTVKGHGWHSVVLVSDPWHSLRVRTMAADVGLDAWASPTHSGPIVQTRQTQLRYILRETGALLYYRATRAPADDIGIDLG